MRLNCRKKLSLARLHVRTSSEEYMYRLRYVTENIEEIIESATFFWYVSAIASKFPASAKKVTLLSDLQGAFPAGEVWDLVITSLVNSKYQFGSVGDSTSRTSEGRNDIPTGEKHENASFRRINRTDRRSCSRSRKFEICT